MVKRSSWIGIAIGCAVLGLVTASSSRASAQEYGYGPTAIDSGAECDDECEAPRCSRCTSFCNKLRMHSIYRSRKACRPYRRLDYTPDQLAPYIGPGTWHSPGYGLPYGAPACPPGGYGYGAPGTAQMGYAR
jgi:hypothetical protein